jgi:hypothetical protein
MHANIHTYKIQQYYSQIIKSTQQHIIKYKSHHSSHFSILPQFPIQYTIHAISNTPNFTNSAARGNNSVLTHSTQEYQHAQPLKPHTCRANNTQVLESHTLDLPLTPPVKPYTRMATIRKC